jgi:hypothetical protein
VITINLPNEMIISNSSMNLSVNGKFDIESVTFSNELKQISFINQFDLSGDIEVSII